MYVQGVSTRKVKAITEERCPMPARPRRCLRSTSASPKAIWPLPAARFQELFPYLILDARTRKCMRPASSEPGGADRRRRRLGRQAANPRCQVTDRHLVQN
ncbi:hypothetical protein [Sinorhizobium saheli]